MIPRVPVHDEDGDGNEPTPFWRRPRVLLVGGIVIVVLIAVLSRREDVPKRISGHEAKGEFIGEVSAYQPPRVIPPAAAATNPVVIATPPPPAMVAQAPPPAAPAPPAMAPPAAPSFRDMLPPRGGNQTAAPLRPRMLVYALPALEKPAPPPPDPAETSLGFKTSTLPGLKASPAIDDTFQLMPGLLPMILDTAIQSDLPGPILAHLPGPVYSPKGVLLMPAGTQVIGKYNAIGRNGENRLMAGSMYAHTPDGIWVPLTGQPMTDDLGRSGLDGEINNHYLQRFGGAVLLTLTDQVLQIVQAEASKGGNTYLNLNGGGGGGVSSLAQQVLQSQINIPPTFSKHQGESIAVFLDQPIDFSASYRIHTVKGTAQ